jgi:predicted metal-dependent phosphotriesterase family hydrolase
MGEREFRSGALNRRDAVKLLGAGAGLSVLTAWREQAAAASYAVNAQPTAARGAVVRTVLEDVRPESITGVTLIHEHLSLHVAAPSLKFYDDVALMTDEVKACAANGVRCIVDAGGRDLGRKIDDLRMIASRSGMLIVACGGLHLKSGYPPDTFHKTEDQIADDFFALATAERWGAIGEMGTGPGVPMDQDERRVLRAAAKLHTRTGLSIITHTSDGCAQCAVDQLDLFESAGVNPASVVIGHLNEIQDHPTVAPMAIAKRGAYAGFDHCGKPDDPRADEYTRTILAMLDAGYEDRVCLSSDFSNGKYLRKNGGPGIDMIMTVTVPRLRRAGIGDAIMHKMLVENPRCALAFVPKNA